MAKEKHYCKDCNALLKYRSSLRPCSDGNKRCIVCSLHFEIDIAAGIEPQKSKVRFNEYKPTLTK
jgi:hypothetical protein